jgi:large subunit ribosomal protein L10
LNRDEKAAVIEEIAAQIEGAEAIFAIDYRGISVPEAAELRSRLREADASFRIVKNRLTKLAAEKAGRSELNELLEGPTALTFVGGDTATAAKAISTFNREHDVLSFKGGFMEDMALDEEKFTSIARLPALDVLHGQFAGIVASPLTGLVRGLNSMIAGLASQLQQMADQGLVTGAPPAGPVAEEASEEAPAEEAPAAEEEPAAEEPAAEEPPTESSPEAEEPAEEAPAAEEEPAAEQEPAEEPSGETEAEESEQAEDESDPGTPGSEADGAPDTEQE